MPTTSLTLISILLPLLLLAICIPLGILMILGGRKMQMMDSYPLAVIGSIVAMLPLHPTFVLGLPVGIWSLVVLMRPDVRRAFRKPHPQLKQK